MACEFVACRNEIEPNKHTSFLSTVFPNKVQYANLALTVQRSWYKSPQLHPGERGEHANNTSTSTGKHITSAPRSLLMQL